MSGPRQVRVLLLPVLFYPEPWNGIMEQLRLLVAHAPVGRVEFLLAVRPGDGAQTVALAERARLHVVHLGDAVSTNEIRRICTEQRIDLVHIHSPSTARVGRLALGARWARVPVLVTYHQVQPYRIGARSRAINRLGHRLLVAHTVAVSSGVADTLAAAAGLDRGRIDVIPNGIDDISEPAGPATSANPGEVTLGYFGRLAAEKGLSFLLDGFAAARAAGAPVRLLVVGDGYEREMLERRAAVLGIAPSVTFTGFREDARGLMQSVDVVVHVPEFEGFGLALVEAMAASRPVIASRVAGGIADLVTDGENGVLVAHGDVDGLAAAISSLAGDSVLRARMGAAGRARYIRDYRAAELVARTVRLYPGME